MALKKFGVDISEWNGAVDFGALKRAGVQFVIIRCGFGSDSHDQDAEQFFENVRKAEAAGIPWGAFLYSYALDTDMARSEAQHMLRLLAGRKPAYGVWYDVEDDLQAGADLVSICEVFCKAMEAAGLYVGIYSMVVWLETKLDSPRLDKYDKWVAQVYDVCEYKKPYGIWQYSHTGVIEGKEFDMNYAYKNYPALTSNKKEDYEMTDEKFAELMERYLKRQAQKHASKSAEGKFVKVKAAKVMLGDANGNFRPQSFIPRQEVATALANILDKLPEAKAAGEE